MSDTRSSDRLQRVTLHLAAGLLALSAANAAGPPSSDTDTGRADGPWLAVAASGAVDSRSEPAAEWQRVVRGDALASRTVVRTGDNGRATLSRGASILMIDPRSELVLPLVATGDRRSSVLQTSGTVVYEVDHRKGRRFEVVTPYLVAGVKGTVFAVTVEDSRVSVAVDEGRVEVTAARNGERLELGPGEAVRFDAEMTNGLEHIDVPPRDPERKARQRAVARANREAERASEPTASARSAQRGSARGADENSDDRTVSAAHGRESLDDEDHRLAFGRERDDLGVDPLEEEHDEDLDDLDPLDHDAREREDFLDEEDHAEPDRTDDPVGDIPDDPGQDGATPP